ACSSGTTVADVPDTGPIPQHDGGTPDASPTPQPDGSTPPDSSTPPDGSTPQACTSTQTSDLDGVTIKFTQANCGFTLAQAAAGIDLTYEIDVAHDIDGATFRPLDEGRCNKPKDGSGLAPMETVAGNGQSYSLFDVGGCVFADGGGFEDTTIKAGTYARTMHWDGKNWKGPSDTSNPEGAPFPAGTYALNVDAQGTQASDAGAVPYDVNGKLTIVLVP
ncbi:MAG TPA: hypothetical protein VGI39_24040, partial [Polyangiaceae bacterium]